MSGADLPCVLCATIDLVYLRMHGPEVTGKRVLNEAYLHLLASIGINYLNPNGAQQFRYLPTPRIRFQISQVDTVAETRTS